MDDHIPLNCPRCGHAWEKSLGELENYEDIYRGVKGKEEPKAKVVKYRAQCPVCGTYVIVTVQED